VPISWQKRHNQAAKREQALQAFSTRWAGAGSPAAEIAACRAFLRVVFCPKWVSIPQIPLRKKLLGSTYAFVVVIFDPY
jgi:hypothetical protein